MFHLMNFFFHRARDLGHRVERQGIKTLLHAEHQRPYDGQRQRQTQSESRPLPARGLDFHCALETRQHALHHIQPHTSTRELGDLFRSRRTRAQNQLQTFRLSQTGRLLCVQQSLRQCALPDLIRINPAPSSVTSMTTWFPW